MTTAIAPHRQHDRSIDIGPPVDRGRLSPRLAAGPVFLIIVVKTLLNLAFASRYGWHVDELYYADSGRHLALGYVDFPPVTPFLAHLSTILYGPSLIGLRSVAVVAGCGVVLVTALITRDLGGRRWAQTVAALAITPVTLTMNSMFQTVSFDQLAWALVLWAATRVLRNGGTRPWVAFGIAAGAAWMTKYTAVLLLAALMVGFVATPLGRKRLHGRGPWLAAGIAAAIIAPNLWWQVRHGWPSIDFFTSHSDGTRADNPPQKYFSDLVLIVGLGSLPIWLAGIGRLLRDRVMRPLGIAVLAVIGGWLLLGGKAYYAVPALIVAMAAGTVAIENRTQSASSPRRRLYPGLVIATTLLSAPLVMPVLPERQMLDLGVWHVRDDYAAELGWPELMDSVTSAWDAVPVGRRNATAIVASNYAEAGAINRWGPARGLPEAVSGHLSNRYWTPSARTLAATRALLVGFDRTATRRLCDNDATPVARITNRAGVDNDERGRRIWTCDLRGTLAERRPDLVSN